MPSNLCPVLWQSYVPMSGENEYTRLFFQLVWFTFVTKLCSTHLILGLIACLALITYSIDALKCICGMLVAILPVQAVSTCLKKFIFCFLIVRVVFSRMTIGKTINLPGTLQDTSSNRLHSECNEPLVF